MKAHLDGRIGDLLLPHGLSAGSGQRACPRAHQRQAYIDERRKLQLGWGQLISSMAGPLLILLAVRCLMAKYTASLAIVTALVATTACDGSGRHVLNPTPLATAGASTHVTIQPSTIRAQRVSQPACPAVPPFVGSLDVHVQAPDFPLTLKRVQLTFIDSTRLAAPTVTLPAPIPTVQFGSALIEARSRRTFPFTFPFGCDTGRTGTLVVFVVISDREGRQTTNEIRIPVQ